MSCLVVCTMNTRYPNCLTGWMIGDKVWESNSRSKLFSERDDPEVDCSVLCLVVLFFEKEGKILSGVVANAVAFYFTCLFELSV